MSEYFYTANRDEIEKHNKMKSWELENREDYNEYQDTELKKTELEQEKEFARYQFSWATTDELFENFNRIEQDSDTDLFGDWLIDDDDIVEAWSWPKSSDEYFQIGEWQSPNDSVARTDSPKNNIPPHTSWWNQEEEFRDAA